MLIFGKQMKKASNHIIHVSWTRHLLLCLVSLNILVASTGFICNIFDYPETPQTEVLVLDTNQDEHFDLEQVYQTPILTISVNKASIKNYQSVIHEIQYARQWNQRKKEILNFDAPVFFSHSSLYPTENIPCPTFIS